MSQIQFVPGARTSGQHRSIRASGAAQRRPVLVINPRDDTAFVAAAESQLDACNHSIARFQDGLRASFPDAFVRARDLSGESTVVWYLFRDGHWVNGRRVDAG